MMFALLCCQMGGRLAQSAPDELAVHLLEQLRRKDETMQRGFYLAGTQHVKYVIATPPGLDRDSSQFELTSDSSRTAWLLRFLQFHGTPRYVQPHTEEAVNDRYDYDEEGNMIFRINAVEHSIYDAGVLCAKRTDVKVVVISPIGAMEISQKQSPVLFLYPIEGGDVTVDAARALLSTGRGYS